MPDDMDKMLAEIQERCDKATMGPIRVGIVDTTLDPLEWFREHLSYGADGADIWCCWLPEHPASQPDPEGRPSHAVLSAITGNGSDSEANAMFYAHARDDVPRLLAWGKVLQSGCRYVASNLDDHNEPMDCPVAWPETPTMWCQCCQALARAADALGGERIPDPKEATDGKLGAE